MINSVLVSPNKKGLSWLYLFIYILLLIVVVVVVVKVYKSLKSGVNSVGNLAADTATSASTGIPIGRLNQIRNIAENLYKNRFEWHYTPWDDWDEAAFITAINQMQNTTELQILCNNYSELSEKSIAYVVKNSFSDGDIAKLKTGYYSTILAM